MNRFILPLLLSMSATAAVAQPGQPQQPAKDAQSQPASQAQIVQASLVLPAGGPSLRGRDLPVAAPSAAREAAQPADESGERSASLMLAAALALMTGIALRRWFLDEQ